MGVHFLYCFHTIKCYTQVPAFTLLWGDNEVITFPQNNRPYDLCLKAILELTRDLCGEVLTADVHQILHKLALQIEIASAAKALL